MNSLKDELLQILVIVGMIIGTFVAVLFFIRYTLILKYYKEIILFLFLDIPIQEVKYMHKNCDKFLSNFISIKEALEKKEVSNNGDEELEEEGEEN